MLTTREMTPYMHPASVILGLFPGYHAAQDSQMNECTYFTIFGAAFAATYISKSVGVGNAIL